MKWRDQGGAYDRPLTIEKKVVTQSGTGKETIADWVPFARTHGRRVTEGAFARAMERFAAEQYQAKVHVEFELAHIVKNLTHEMRLIDQQDGVVYDIKGVTPSEFRGGGQRVTCLHHAD